MARYATICVLMAVGLTSARGYESAEQYNVVKTGLTLDGVKSSLTEFSPTTACERVSFTRNLKYGESELHVLDVATSLTDLTPATPRPVLLFVMGEQFSYSSLEPIDQVPDEAMCFAAMHKMIGVKINYRRSPKDGWPAGTTDVADATSWISQNIDLFGGDRNAIIAVGYSAGAFHIATLLAHPEFRIQNAELAGAILVSGIYSTSIGSDADEKAYFGADSHRYDQRSIFPGILNIDTPLLLAWSAQDSPRLVAQAQNLRERLCESAAHCPRSAVLKSRDSPAAYFRSDASGDGLAKPTLELVREIEARGLP